MDDARALRRTTGSRWFTRAACVSGCLFLFSCFDQPLEPVLPSWDANLSVPLINRQYSLSEIVEKDTSLLHVGVGGQIIYSTSVQAAPTYVGDRIAVQLRDTSLGARFGAFQISVPDIDIPVALPWLPQGATVPIPDTSLITNDLHDTIQSFQRVTFSQGTITLTLQNNLPVRLSVQSPIRMLNRQGEIVATFQLDSIPPNSSRTSSDNLAHRTFDNTVTVEGISIHTPGSQSPVPIPFGALLSAHIGITDVKAQQAIFASIPPQRLTNNDTTRARMDDSTLIKELFIKSGSFTLGFTSHLPLDVVFKYRLNELLRPAGGIFVPYEDSLSLIAGATDSHRVSLSGMKMMSNSGDLLRSLQIISSMILPSGSATPVTVNDTDKVIVSVTGATSLIADSVIGVLKPTMVHINSVIPLRFGSLPNRFTGQITIPSAVLGLWTASTVEFPMDVSLRIGARINANGDSAFLAMPFSQKRLNQGSDLILFDQGDVGAFLSRFSGHLPDSLHIEGKSLLNPPDVYNPSLAGVHSVGGHCSLGGRVDMEIPLMMGIVSGTFRDSVALGDTTGDGRKDYKIDKKRINDIGGGTVFVEVTNAMPVAIGFSLQLLDSSNVVLLHLPQNGSPIQIASAGVDADGNVTIPARTTTTIVLSRDEVQQFNPAEYLSYALLLNTPPGVVAARFRTSDYVKVRAWSTLTYRIH